MHLHFLTNAIFGQILRQIWLSKYSHTLRGMRRFYPAIFSLSPDRNFQGQALAQILCLHPKKKTQMYFSG